jgi:hypothetical protein
MTLLSRSASPWDRESWLAIGRVLLVADERTLTAPEIAATRGVRSSSRIKAEADAMVEAGLLERRPPPARGEGIPGRGPQCAYFLPLASAHAVGTRTPAQERAGLLRAGMQLVFADAGSEQTVRLLQALASAGSLRRAVWFALCDGEPQQYAIAFAGDEAIEAATDLMAELRGAELRAQRANVTEVQSIDRLAQRAKRSARGARKAKRARATRQAP